MAKIRHLFVCRSCGGVQSRWMGKCPDCGEWDSLEEHRHDASAERDPHRGSAEAWIDEQGSAIEAKPIGQIRGGGAQTERMASGIGELDRVLGGAERARGLVAGSAVLIGGNPGIGKSTLMLQAAGAWARGGHRTMYVTSEESAEQVHLRAQRLGVGDEDELLVLADTNLARIVEQARKTAPAVLVLDSVQMIYKADLDASPGSVAQLRRCASELVMLAKVSGMAVVLVGHVTKDGRLAGPRLLEHLVDAVLSFEGDRHHAHRVVRSVKNRFGTTLEIGLFEMTGAGLVEVTDPAGAAGGGAGPGSVLCPVVTGTRCMLVEVQALTATGFLGAAKRKASGIDTNRLAMLIAVLEQHAEMRLADRDVFASSVGGVRVVEPAADLALLMAIAGAERRRGLGAGTAVIGEVGLSGEVRAVTQLEQRLRECARLSLTRVILPAAQADSVRVRGVEVVGVKTVCGAIESL